MKVTFKLNSIGKNLSELINDKLSKEKLPICIGDMSPPLVPAAIDIEVENIFKLKSSVPQENIVESDIGKLIVPSINMMDHSQYVLDINSSMEIENTKESLASQYVERIKKCAAPCKYIELCNMLTTHYLATIKISGGGKC